MLASPTRKCRIGRIGCARRLDEVTTCSEWMIAGDAECHNYEETLFFSFPFFLFFLVNGTWRYEMSF